MAKTELQEYTVQEKLNKMDADVISVSVTVATSAANDIMIAPTTIPNAVSVPGGTCIIQSIVSHCPTADDQSYNLVISDSITALHDGIDQPLDANEADGILTAIQGVVPIPAGYAVGTTDYVASVSSIGMIAKAAEGSKDLYVWGISTTGDTISTTFNLKFGIVKD